MPFAPWTQQVQGARAGEEPAVDYSEKDYGLPWEKSWWEEPWRNIFETTPEGGMGRPINPGRWAGLIGAGLTGGLATWPGMAGAGIAGIGGALKSIPAWMGSHKLLTGAGAILGGGAIAANLPGSGGASGMAWDSVPGAPYTGSGLPSGAMPSESGQAYQPPGAPEIVDVNGTKFWRYSLGIDADGNERFSEWQLLPSGAAGDDIYRLTSQEQINQYDIQRQAELEQIRLRYELERGMQGAGAAQTMAQTYAEDPYKYWAQLGMGTPGAMARLTGGEIAPGEEFKHTPLSHPSSQWWGNLLPSEQQQIMGGINWMGVDPQDWYSTYQRMIPGLGSRQMEPLWQR